MQSIMREAAPPVGPPARSDLELLGLHLAGAVAAGELLPRKRRVGPLTLDLLHRDARQAAAWLRLHPREFALLWRLSDRPGEVVSRRQLLHDVWRIDHEPETNSVGVHVSRLRAKLTRTSGAVRVETVPDGGYRLALAAQGPQACGRSGAAAPKAACRMSLGESDPLGLSFVP